MRELHSRVCIRGHRDGSFDIAVSGHLDLRRALSLRHLIEDLPACHVTLDLTECHDVTPSAVPEIDSAISAAEAGGRTVRVQRPFVNDAAACG